MPLRSPPQIYGQLFDQGPSFGNGIGRDWLCDIYFAVHPGLEALIRVESRANMNFSWFMDRSRWSRTISWSTSCFLPIL